MIRPRAFNFVCPKCGKTIKHQPKSDALLPLDMPRKCPKCNVQMKPSCQILDTKKYENHFGRLDLADVIITKS
jgi:predicted RNA-binding Zn-ribbon protein involved in translation (DUF1610 family)